MPTTLEGHDLPEPGHRGRSDIDLRPDHQLRPPDLQAGRPGQADHHGGRLPLRDRPDRQGAPAAEQSRLAVAGPVGDPQPPRRADDQPRCRRRPVAPARTPTPGSGTEAPAHCPDNAKIGTITISSAALPNDLEGSIYFGEPKPGNQYRLLIIAEGYGIRTKFLGDLLPDPKTGQIKAVFTDLPQLPFDEYEIHLFASDRGVLATPTHCADPRSPKPTSSPGTTCSRTRNRSSGSAIDSGPGGVLCPGEIRPFNPAARGGNLELAGRRLQQLLSQARPRRRRPVPRRPQLHDAAGPDRIAARHHLLPGGVDRRRVAQGGPRRADVPRAVPLSSKLGTTNVAAGPGLPPLPRGRRHLSGRAIQGCAAFSRGDHPGPGRAL